MQHPRLLIVDDDDQVRSVVHSLVEEAFPFAHISDHKSCRRALQEIEADGADLVITDCHMPDMDGPTMVRTLRERNFSLPIIMVSGSGDARKLAQQAGVDRFIEKRFLDPDLSAAIHTLLDAA